MWMGNMTEWSGYGYVEATRKAQDGNYWRQLITSDPAMDVNITEWSGYGYVEATSCDENVEALPYRCM